MRKLTRVKNEAYENVRVLDQGRYWMKQIINGINLLIDHGQSDAAKALCDMLYDYLDEDYNQRISDVLKQLMNWRIKACTSRK